MPNRMPVVPITHAPLPRNRAPSTHDEAPASSHRKGDEAGAELSDQAREARRERRRASEDSRPRISMDSNNGGETWPSARCASP